MSELEYSDSDENYDFEDGNYGEEFEEDSYGDRSSSPIPEDDTLQCVYCRKSLFSLPHTCRATKGCKNKNSLIIKCQCKWHKQLKEL